MKTLRLLGTRRQLFRTMAAGAASLPLLVLGRKAARADASASGCEHSGGRAAGCACFLAGTRIAAGKTEVRVQDLAIGDEVLTSAGPQPIKWIGYSKFTKDEDKSWIDTVMPIRVARSAIADHLPHSDLYLSPGHCIFFNEALIPVKYLVNGISIARGMPSDMSVIEYYNIEFDTHELLYAEGALVESFIEEESERETFSNFAEYKRLYGTEPEPRMTPFAPVLKYRNRRQEVLGFARSLVSNVVDVRDPIQIAYDQIARRAETMLV